MVSRYQKARSYQHYLILSWFFWATLTEREWEGTILVCWRDYICSPLLFVLVPGNRDLVSCCSLTWRGQFEMFATLWRSFLGCIGLNSRCPRDCVCLFFQPRLHIELLLTVFFRDHYKFYYGQCRILRSAECTEDFGPLGSSHRLLLCSSCSGRESYLSLDVLWLLSQLLLSLYDCHRVDSPTAVGTSS